MNDPLAFYVEIEVLEGVEIENLKSTVITIDFDNHYDFIQIRKKGKVLHKSAFFWGPLLKIRRTDFWKKLAKTLNNAILVPFQTRFSLWQHSQ